jgi:purine-binding chemotaxis protein CheW
MPDSHSSSSSVDLKPGSAGLELHSRRLLVFQMESRLVALPLEAVERITPMAELACPPGLPSALEGVLNLAGAAIPVLRLDRLFELPPQKLTLYSMLVVLRVSLEGRIAMRVDRVTEILSVAEDAFLPIDQEDSFNSCAEATVAVGAGTIHVLSPTRMLLKKEHEALLAFQAMAQRRLQGWEAGLT